jgi:glutamate 5-kinase
MDLGKYSLVIIKVGTNSIMDESGLKKAFLTELAGEVNSLSRMGKRIVIVSSGAIGLGKKKISFTGKATSIKEQQGLAAIGQVSLMKEYLKRLESFGLEGAQVLLSQQDLLNKECFENIKNTFDFLFENKIIPIVNENDVVATAELRTNGVFSDNDALASLLAKQIHANLLVMLTTKNGLIARDGSVIPLLHDTSTICPMGETSRDGRGGIYSKINAINTAGCDVFISGPDTFKGFTEGKAKGTFIPKK